MFIDLISYIYNFLIIAMCIVYYVGVIYKFVNARKLNSM